MPYTRCPGYAEYHVDPRNNLEVFCDFSRCNGGYIVSNIIWDRELNVRQGWHLAYHDSASSIIRLGTYKSLLRVRNYRPWKDDGVYRCRAKMLLFHKNYPCYGSGYRHNQYTNCHRRQNIETVFSATNVFGRRYRQNSNFLYDNIGYDYTDYRNRYKNRYRNYQYDPRYRNYGSGNGLRQIRF